MRDEEEEEEEGEDDEEVDEEDDEEEEDEEPRGEKAEGGWPRAGGGVDFILGRGAYTYYE